MLYLDRNIEEEKSEILAKFYASCINMEISLNQFYEYATVLNQCYIEDLKTLYCIYKENKDNFNIENLELYRISRLISVGLLSNYSGGILVREMSGENSKRAIYEQNEFGKKFVEIANKKWKEKCKLWK